MISLKVALPTDRTTIASAGLVSLLHRRTDRSHLPAISVLGDLAAVFCTPKQALIFLISHFKRKDNLTCACPASSFGATALSTVLLRLHQSPSTQCL